MNPERTFLSKILEDGAHGVETLKQVVAGAVPKEGTPERSVYVRAIGRACADLLGELRRQLPESATSKSVKELVDWLLKAWPTDPERIFINDREAEGLSAEDCDVLDAWWELVHLVTALAPDAEKLAWLIERARKTEYLLNERWALTYGPMVEERLWLKKRRASTTWRLIDSTGDPVGHPVSFGLVASLEPEAHSVRFSALDGVEVLAVLVTDKEDGVIRRAAACERVAGEWSRWRVAEGLSARHLAKWALVVPDNRRARIGDTFIVTGSVKEPYEPLWHQGRLWWLSEVRFEPPAEELWFRKTEDLAKARLPQGPVRISHPDHYELEVENPTGWITLGLIKGTTYPVAAED